MSDIEVSTDPPPGLLRRCVITRADGHEVRAGVEDNFHHFELLLQHDGHVVIALSAIAPRSPWTLCPSAGAQLQALVGQPIGMDIHRRAGLPDAREQCTHQYELALLAIAQAARGGERRYDMIIPAREGSTLRPVLLPGGVVGMKGKHLDGCTCASLWRDGIRLLQWEIVHETIAAPHPFTGQTLRGLGAWAMHETEQERFDDDQLEAVKVLRRAAHVAGGRIVPLDLIARADLHPPAMGGCFVLQPQRAGKALRNVGSTLEFGADVGDDALLRRWSSGL